WGHVCTWPRATYPDGEPDIALRCYRFSRTNRVAVPIRFCSRCGLPCRFRCRIRGALLPHLFTLAAPSLSDGGAVRSLWHFPWGCPPRTLSVTVCRWSPDFPPPQPFDHSGSGRPADRRPCAGGSQPPRPVAAVV